MDCFGLRFGVSMYFYPFSALHAQCMISKGNVNSVTCNSVFVFIFFKQCIIKQLEDSVFVIS